MWHSVTLIILGSLLAITAADPALSQTAAGSGAGTFSCSSPGGAGATGYTGNNGVSLSANGNGCPGGGGGGGGAGGGSGGTGMGNFFSNEVNAPGGTGGASPGANGGNGADGTAQASNDGSGGGGGGGGANGNGSGAPSLSVVTTLAGGNGGNGGAGGVDTNGGGGDGGGGGGGAGGYGAIVTGSSTSTNAGTITGGNGGNGGASFYQGNGGGGGIGVLFTANGATFTNSGMVTGGSGGTGGANGGGGVGIYGAGLTINNSGSITGGGGANAIEFTGGANMLNLSGSWSLTGAVAIDSGSLSFTQSGAETVSNHIIGGGSILQTGGGTLTLSGSNSYSGGTTVTTGSTLILANNHAAGNGAINLDVGSTLGLHNVAITNTVSGTGDPDIVANGTNSMPAFTGTAGTTFNILGANNSVTDLLTITTANASYAGTINVGGTAAGSTVTLIGGATNAFGSNAAVSVYTGSVLDLGGHNQAIGSLSGAGQISNNGGSGFNTLTIGGGASSTFSGTITDGSHASTALTVANSGTSLTLSGANTYTGGTTVSTGSTLVLGNNSAAGNGGVTLQTGSTLGLSNATISNSISATGTVAISANGVTGMAMPTFAGPGATMNILGANNSASDVLGLSTQNTTFGGAINVGGTAAGSAVTVKGAATNAFGSAAPVSVYAGSVIDLGGYNQAVGSLSGAGHISNSAASGTNTLTIGGGTSSTFSGAITDGLQGSTALTVANSGTSLTLSGTNTYTGATNVNGGTLDVTGSIGSTQLSGGAINVMSNATLDVGATGVIALSGVDLTNAGTINVAHGGSVTDALLNIGAVNNTGTYNADVNNSTANGIITNTAGGVWNGNLLTNTTGASVVNSGQWNGMANNAATLTNAAGAVWTGAGTNLGSATLYNYGTWTGTMGNAGTLLNEATGTLSGLLTNTGGITVDLGQLNGGANVTGGVLTGTGSVGNTTIGSGGTFAPGSSTPGSSMTVNGTLALASGAQYVVQINPITASLAHVTGAATLDGATVGAIFANGSYIAKQYTILTAAGGVNGTFAETVSTNLPANFHTSLSYDTNDAYLNLALNYRVPGGFLNANQLSVANTLTNFFNTTGGIPMAFSTLYTNALTQASGETVTGTQQTTINAMNMFMGVLTDPFAAGRGDSAPPQGGVTAYADPRDANALFSKAVPVKADSFAQRWRVWASGFGGAQTTEGNAVVGSSTANSSIYGTAVGADYRVSPDTLFGFAMAGGGTGFSVANSGYGHSELFQAGAFLRSTVGAAYLSGALAYGWQDVTTNRTVTITGFDQLQARFNANTYSGRLESGYRYVAPWIGGVGLTPYASGTFTTFALPSYAESVVSGVNTFALAYGAQTVTDVRSEIGLRTDKSFVLKDAVLTLRGRAAWEHDFDPDRGIGATFQTLPGASFAVNGAAQARDATLTMTSAELKWTNGWSIAATFEGEFSDVTRSYAGKGSVRYQW